MCVTNLTDWKINGKDIIAYKVCRVDAKGRFRSSVDVAWRSRQESYKDGAGTDEIYTIGKKKKSSRVGYYCYASKRLAKSMRSSGQAVLQVVIPAGIEYRKGGIRGNRILAKRIIPVAVIVKGADKV